MNKFIRKNKFITRLFFGIKIPATQEIHWDFTTLTLKYAIDHIVKINEKVLDMGTGPYALLALSSQQKGIKHIQTCDINKQYVASARRTIEYNDAAINVIYSDLFSEIDGKYDIIVFNAVYIPRDIGVSLGLPMIHVSDTHWCGGVIGTETIETFLGQAKAYMQKDGKILLGFNPNYVPMLDIRAICEKYNYRIFSTVRHPLSPSAVFVLKTQ